MSAASSFLALALNLSVFGAPQEKAETPLTALFEGQIGLSFKTVVQPGGTPLGWGGAVLTSGARGAHRVVVDNRGKFFLIYKIRVEPISQTQQRFRLSIEPPDAEAVDRFKRSLAANTRQYELFNYPAPQEISFGDVVTLEILEDPSRNVKIVDLLFVVDAQGLPRLGLAGKPPRDFTLADVELKMIDYQLKADGRSFKGGGGCSGAIIWFYLPGYGRFLFSVVDRPGYGFQRMGVIHDNRIVFSHEGIRYEWISSEPALQPGVWNLWVRPDPDYRPPVDPLPDALTIGAADAVGYLLEPDR